MRGRGVYDDKVYACRFEELLPVIMLESISAFLAFFGFYNNGFGKEIHEI